jgi:hypothetical protein
VTSDTGVTLASVRTRLAAEGAHDDQYPDYGAEGYVYTPETLAKWLRNVAGSLIGGPGDRVTHFDIVDVLETLEAYASNIGEDDGTRSAYKGAGAAEALRPIRAALLVMVDEDAIEPLVAHVPPEQRQEALMESIVCPAPARAAYAATILDLALQVDALAAKLGAAHDQNCKQLRRLCARVTQDAGHPRRNSADSGGPHRSRPPRARRFRGVGD